MLSLLIAIDVTYAMWSALGMVLISVAAYVVYDQKLDLLSITGMSMIIAGCLVINICSKKDLFIDLNVNFMYNKGLFTD